jgi:CHAT domain-containing protein/tetratricopeptide (TPR) repeat protein
MRRHLIACGLASLLVACGKAHEGRGSSNGAVALHSSAQADSILTLGEAAYHRSEYDSAESILSAGRAVAVASGDSQAVARADTWRGLTAWKQGIHGRSRALGEAALAMKLRLGLKADLWRSYNALGLLAYVEGRYSDAQTLFAQARSSAEAVHDTIGVAKAVSNLGLVHSEIGDFQQARTEFAVLERAAHLSRDAKAEGDALSNRGMLETRDGNPTEAILWLQRARPLYASIPSHDGEESVLGQLGSAYAMMDQPQKAIAYMDSAISVARSHDLVREQAEDLQIYAELLGEAGDHQAALRHLANARILADSAGLGSRVGDIAGAQARELVSISRNDLALQRAEEASSIHLKVGERLEELEDRLLVAEIAQASHKGDMAQDELARAHKIASTLATPVAEEDVSLGTARVADVAVDPAGVLRALPTDAAFPRLGESAAGEAEALRARAFARLRQWPEAVGAGQRAIASLELVRQGLGEGPLRAAFTSDKSQVYADLVIALLHLGRSSDAFEVADAARGKALLEHLSAMRGSVRASAGDLAEADRILRRIDYLTEKLRGADTVRSPDRSVPMRKDLRDLADKLALARKEYEDLISTVARTDPRGATLLGIEPVHAIDVRKTLSPNEVLIEYLATNQRLLIFAATRDTVLSASSPISLDDLANRVRLASELLRKSTMPGAGHDVMRALYDLLMDPVEKMKILRPGATIIVVPHSALAYLPFAALVQPDGKLLVESYPLLELPSAAALSRLRSEVSTASGGSAVFAPFPDELAGTRDEAIAVSRMTMRPTTYLGERATERQVRAALATSRIVHIASHALLDQINPLFSHVELAAAARSSPEDDGSLAVHELLQIPVRSELVYLSGCETGAGAAWSTSFRRSQDYATLSQAMLYAGAQNVVATLWRIDDAGASVFARRFYAALSNTDPVDALAIAQRAMIRDSRYSAPRYWAGYTVSGSGEMKIVTQGHRTVAVK